MAHVQKRGDRWQARYRDTAGKEHTKRFTRKVDAQRWLDHAAGQLVAGAWVDPTAGRRTFGEYAAAWQAIQAHRETTAALVDSHLRNHMLPAFADRPMAAIRPSEIQAWVKARSVVLAPATVETAYRFLVAIFAAAVRDRLVATTPCVGIKLPRVEHPQVVPLAVEGVHALVDAIPARYRALVVLAAGSGLRQGECFGLAVPAVDFLRRSLRVEQQVTTVNGRTFVAAPKTEASRRTVPLPGVVVSALAAHAATFEPGDGGLIFTNANGEAIRRPRFGEVWRRAVAGAGLVAGLGTSPAPLPGGTRFHELRHFYASVLIASGASIKVVQTRLGHASAAETLDTYSHLFPDEEDKTRQALDAALSTDSGRAGQPRADNLRTADGLEG